MNKVNKTFTAAWDRTTRSIPYNPAWSNGGGQYDYAIYGEHAAKIPVGEMVRSSTNGGRRMLLIGTRLGNMIIYDRFTQQGPGQKDEDRAVFFYNAPTKMSIGAWFGRTYLDEFDMSIAVGDEVEPHIGWRINQLWAAFKETLTEKAVA